MNLAAHQGHLAAYLARHPGITRVATLAEYGYTACPTGLAITLTHGQTILTQTTYRDPAAGPTTPGRHTVPPPPPALPTVGRTPTATIEQLLAAAHAGLPVAHLDLYSTRPTPPRVGYGVVATLTDNTAFYTHLRHTLRPTEIPSSYTLFRPLKEL